MIDLHSMLALLGLALLAAGVAYVYRPAALMLVGACLLAAGVLPKLPRSPRWRR